MKFKLTIDSENAGVTPMAVAGYFVNLGRSLAMIAPKIASVKGMQSGSILDENGNSMGQWEFEMGEPHDPEAN